MLLSKLALVSAFVFPSIVSSQVVVTITNTVTVVTSIVTLTVTPKSTSTSYTYVTVTGSSPPQTTALTSTLTVVVTATAPTPTASSCPIAEWSQCGGQGYSGSCGKCATNAVCKYKDVWYSYCSNLPEVVHAISTVYMP